jgi:hypothetical protein
MKKHPAGDGHFATGPYWYFTFFHAKVSSLKQDLLRAVLLLGKFRKSLKLKLLRKTDGDSPHGERSIDYGDARHVSECANISHDAPTFSGRREHFLGGANILWEARSFYGRRGHFMAGAIILWSAQIKTT